MANLSEFDIVKLFVEKPIKLEKSFAQLNLKFFKDFSEDQV